ncbi:MAG: YihY/virulence factor BrkB family protein [Acidobacteria bacterium]|jgi:membrane protein|nr:YihY/virulence factor BrkB family protein [Acidobacteriota bacterium]
MIFKNFQFKTFFSKLYDKVYEEDILSSAAQVAFYFSFALFPLLLFLISLFGMVLSSAEDLRGELFFYLRQIMPVSAYELVQTTIKEVTENSSGGKLTLGFFTALWFASAGVDSIRVALNSVYNLVETRDWWKTKLLSLIFTVVIAILVSIALAIVFYGWKFISFALSTLSLPVPSPFFLIIIQWVAILIVLLIVFGLLYNYIPNHSPFKWTWITPGAVVGIILWLLLSNGFRLYLNYFNTYDKTYGSLGAVIILMLWLFLTALVILIGGLINRTIDEMTVIEEKLKDKQLTNEIRNERIDEPKTAT